MGQPHNVLRVHCNVSSEDFLEVGHIINREATDDQQVYIRIENEGDACEINITRREACLLAQRILSEFQEVPSTPFR